METGCKDNYFFFPSKFFLEKKTKKLPFPESFASNSLSLSSQRKTKMKDDVSLHEIFGVFAKIGAFTIGGGYAMIPIIQREMSSRGWIEEDELPDIIALAQSAPGVLAVNMSIFAGYKLRGVKGSIAATLGAILPSFFAILLIAIVFSSFKDNPVVIRIFKGIRPVVAALILVPMTRMAINNNHTWWAWAISAGTLIAVAFLKFSPIYILLVLLVAAFSVTYLRERKEKEGRS